MKPIVSIVMGVYKNIDWLPVTLETIIKQSFKRFEVIIIDDGNDCDSSRSICQIGAMDHRIRVIKNDLNEGLTAALIKGCNDAKGDYIARIDNGDLMVPETRLEEQVEWLGSQAERAIIGGQIDVADCLNRVIWRSTVGERYHEELMAIANDCNTAFEHVTVMFKKTAYLKSGGYVKEQKTGQDTDLWRRVLEYGEGRVVDRVYAVAPMREDSISVAFNNRQILNKANNIRKNILSENGFWGFSLVLREYLKLFIPLRTRLRLRYRKSNYELRLLNSEEIADLESLKSLYY